MSNTGKKIYRFLKQIDTATGLPTGLRKPNDISDPDYVQPITDYVVCPVTDWRPIDEYCVLTKDDKYQTGYKGWIKIEKLENGIPTGHTEENSATSGFPYFPPVFDPISCPIQG